MAMVNGHLFCIFLNCFHRINRETMLTHQPRPTGVTLTTIHFPSPHPTSFAVAGVTPAYGAPQVTTAGRPQEQPQWNQPMFFLGDESSLFTTTSALVVEYYPASLGEIQIKCATLFKAWLSKLESKICFQF